MTRTNLQPATFHQGLDYAVVMLDGETTETASISLHGEPGENARLAETITRALNGDAIDIAPVKTETYRNGEYYEKDGKVWRAPVVTKTPTGETVEIGFLVCTPSPCVNAKDIVRCLNAARQFASLAAALDVAIAVAGEARDASGKQAGKLLIALSDPSLKYRPDITAIHAARTAAAAV